MSNGSYDFYILLTSLLILALQIHNPFQARQQQHQCACPVAPVGGPAATAQPDTQPPPAQAQGPAPRGSDSAPVYRRPREAAAPAEPPAAGLSTDALLRELDKIQVKAKEQHETLAAAGRMPPPSPILQQLKESDAASVGGGSGGQGLPMDREPLPVMRPPTAGGSAAAVGDAGGGGGIAVATGWGTSPQQVSDVPLLRRRTDFGRFLEQRQPRGLGIVLGVGHGDFAARLLEDWASVQGIYLVDPYIHIFRGYNDPANVDDREQQKVFENLRSRLQPFDGRYVLMRDFSYSFAESYQRGVAGMGGPPSFVYVDNNHAEEAVARDLEAWWPLLAGGGCLAGSTYADDPGSQIGVRTAVDRFAMRQRVKVYLTHEDMPPSWFIFKL